MNWKQMITIGCFGILLQGATNAPMVLIPKGSFIPLYTVGEKKIEVDSFYLDSYPITNQDYQAFVKSHPRWKRSHAKPIFAEKNYLKNWRSDLSFQAKIEQNPVTHVSWFSAKAYCSAQGKKLPTSEQWEYAALASKEQPNGARKPKFRERILNWYGRPTPHILPNVKESFKNYYGVYGMHGLVWEWVRNFNTILVTGESREDTGLNRNLFCAGGVSGSTDPSDYAAYMRYAYRSSLKASYTIKNLGFRCAKDIK